MIAHRILYTSSSPWIFSITKAEGCFLWDSEGHKMIDFTSGWNVTNLGWNHPEVTKAVIAQANKNTYVPMETADPAQIAYATALTDALPGALKVAVRATGGTEANEEALKISRAYTKRKKIIGFKHTYHGQSFGTMSIGYVPEYVKHIAPLVPEFIQLDYPQTYRTNIPADQILPQFLETLESLLKQEDVAAMVTEAGIVTGWGSTVTAPSGYLQGVRELTKKYGTLLIIDEVGTGFSRCGALFGMMLEGVEPDIATFAKGISNGAAAIGAAVTTEAIANEVFDKANTTSTFGWMPVACAAASAVLTIHQREKVWEKAKADGDYIVQTLRKELANHNFVGNIDGKGMEIGIDLVRNKQTKEKNVDVFAAVMKKGREKGLLLNGDGEGNIQLMPPLVIDRKLLDEGLEILIDVLQSVS